MQHAFLIIAHNDFGVLQKLVALLDNPLNNIYVHIDKKTKDFKRDELYNCVQYSKLKIYSEYSVAWGDESQVKCEMFLLEKAFADGFDYCHFLSGVDLPLHSMEYLHKFFETNKGKEFIHFDNPVISESAMERVKYYHFWSDKLKKSPYRVIRKMLFIFDSLFVKVQKCFHISKPINYTIIQKGCNWCSITYLLAEYVLKSKNKIFQLLKYSVCGDEIFIQTVCINSDFKEKLYNKNFDNNYEACVRFIKWDENNQKSPKTLNDEDFDDLVKSKCLFARKFSTLTESNFVEKWVSYVTALDGGL